MAEEAAATRSLVLRLLPEAVPDFKDVLVKRTRLYVVIHKHVIQDGKDNSDEAFIWIKAHSKVTIATITDTYRAQFPDDDLSVTVRMLDGTVPCPETRMGELPSPDQVLVLTATVAPAIPSGSSLDSSLDSSTPRTPLQAVNRQLTLPPVASPDEQAGKSTIRSANMSPPVPPVPSAAANHVVDGITSTHITPEPHNLENSLPLPTTSDLPSERLPLDQEYDQPSNTNPVSPSAKEHQNTGDDVDNDMAYQPRDQGDLFADRDDEPEQSQQPTRGVVLQQLLDDATPERLEAGVAAGLRVLSDIETSLQELNGNEEAQNWMSQIEKVRKEATKTRTVVGVVGNTGAGKSSVINAMLEEERLVPTNCMRACTAVVTELSYNESSNPRQKYRAEIQFVQPEEWRKELAVLFREIFDDGDNLVKEISNPDSEAGVAYAKIRAVYHKHTRDMLAKSTIDSLMKQKQVKNVLGQTCTICEQDPAAFYRRLQRYVDSREKGTEKKDKNGNKITERKRSFEYWPLIKVVKIYTKAEALSTGAVVVDLPGVHDSNAARGAVAEGYIKQCTGLWIVAPINRAVDDKAAKTLLGNTFKRQLKFDGTYSAVTFICSKTDDISKTEAVDSLDLGDEMTELDEQLRDITAKRRDLMDQLKEERKSKDRLEETVEQLDEDAEKWEELEIQVQKGNTVFAPASATSTKRKRDSTSGANKRRRGAIHSDDSDYAFEPASSQEAEEPAGIDQSSKDALTEESISEKLEEFKQSKKKARREKRLLEDRIQEVRTGLHILEEQQDSIDAKQDAICIAGRNEYSRRAIRQDFAAGIRELDQENAAEDHPDSFDPNEELRDYDEVARSLPVYCVSSRAYQRLSGRLKKDSAVAGFTDVRETEIPQLQAHCKKLTEKGRQATCRRFLNSLKQLLSSLGLWSSDDGAGTKLTVQQRCAEKAWLARKLRELEKALEKVIESTLEAATSTLDDQLFCKFQVAVKSAVDDAIPTSSKWGARKDEGGLVWATYKATVRRNGVFAGVSGHRDFNNELAEPIYKQLASAWEKAFQRRLPQILHSFTRSATSVLQKFHSAVEQRTREKGHGIARLSMIGSQLQAYGAIFSDLVSAATQELNEGQRDLNREFTPVIARIMEPVYETCAAERGPGSFKRMKDMMMTHVTEQQASMFESAAEQVRKGLLKLCERIKENMLNKADETFLSLQRDYLTIVGVNSTGEVTMTREERSVRYSIDETIDRADSHFRDVLAAVLNDLRATLAVKDDEEPTEWDEVVDDEMELDDASTDDEMNIESDDGADHLDCLDSDTKDVSEYSDE